MKVRMLLPVSGTCNGEPWPRGGEVADLPDEQAQQAIDAEIAVKVPADTKVTTEPTWGEVAYETATAPDAEVTGALTTASGPAKRASRKPKA